MKILIELPNDWLDGDMLDELGFLHRTVRGKIHETLVEAILKQVKLPRFKFSHKDLKVKVEKRIVELLAERALSSKDREV